ncbi:MAG: TonB-dependent receptor domain-containing protein [Steroidobacteraceae bacterium]
MKEHVSSRSARVRRGLCAHSMVGGLGVLAALGLMPVSAWAGSYGAVRGRVEGLHNQPMAGVRVTLRSAASGSVRTTRTDAKGRFAFPTVSIGTYRISVRRKGFQPQRELLTVEAGYFPKPVLHLLPIATFRRIVVRGSQQPVVASVTPITLVSQQQIEDTPGAVNVNSLSMITDYVPGAYEAHDMLHIRGGHQTNWLIDGVEIPNTNIAENLGPAVDPQDIQTLGIEQGSYNADEGDRTYGVFNVIPKTGFGVHDQGLLSVSAGNFGQTDDYLSAASHTGNFAYYVSAEGNRSNLGLQTPVAQVIHDQSQGYGLFTNLQYNPDSRDDLRFVAQLRQDTYQIPNCLAPLPNDPQCVGQQGDTQKEADNFALLSWVHTFTHDIVLTSSLMYHFESAAYDGGAQDYPSITTFHHSSQYEGGEENLRMHFSHNHVDFGVYGFAQQDHADFNIAFAGGTPAPLQELESPTGHLVDAWAQDTYALSHWVHLSAGVRYSDFKGLISESAIDPRYGATVRVPRLNWVFSAFWGKYYQAPPLESLGGPLVTYASAQNSRFLPLHGERDRERQFGVTIPLAGWTAHVDYFVTQAQNFFDHNPIGESDIYLPITDQGALIRGRELTVASPAMWRYGQVHLAYSNQTAQCFGSISGGLVVPGTACGNYVALDHDQRNTLSVGYNVDLPQHYFVGTNVSVNSGLANGFAGPPTYEPSHLPSYAIIDLTVGRNFSRNLQVSVTALNLANKHLMTDNSLTFGGVHWNNPFQIYAELRYKFHY